MRKILLYILMPMLGAGLLSGCESLEDTYSEYAGDGPIRYLSKCADLEASPKWEEVELTWTNKTDAGREAIKISWSDESMAKDTVIDRDAESCVIPGLGNSEYLFSVTAISYDEDNNIAETSMDADAYARPYSLEHEVLSTFTRVVIKQFKVGDSNLFLFFDNWKDNLSSVEIGYYKQNEDQETRVELTKVNTGTADDPEYWPNGQEYMLLRDVDFTKDVKVYRSGDLSALVGSPLEISFPEITLNLNVLAFNSDFASHVQDYLNVTELTANTIKDVEVLEFDQDISSLEDILYFPNLKEIYLGKNRYMDSYYASYDSYQSSLSEKEQSLTVLNLAHDLLNVEVHQYNSHYFSSWEAPTWFQQEGNPELPALDLLNNTASWAYTVTPEDQKGYDSYLSNLFDDNAYSSWVPMKMTNLRVHDVEIELPEETDIRGFKVVQSSYLESMLLPNIIEIQIAEEGGEWKQATFQEEVPLGDTNGETTLIYLNNEKKTAKAKRIRFYVTDKDYYSYSYGTGLADFMVIL